MRRGHRYIRMYIAALLRISLRIRSSHLPYFILGFVQLLDHHEIRFGDAENPFVT